jgi:hypothetical protein
MDVLVCFLLSLEWEEYTKYAPFAERTLHRDPTAMFVQYFRNNGQAETDAIGFRSEKRIEDVLDVLGVNAGAAVDYAHLHFGVIR